MDVKVSRLASVTGLSRSTLVIPILLIIAAVQILALELPMKSSLLRHSGVMPRLHERPFFDVMLASMTWPVPLPSSPRRSRTLGEQSPVTRRESQAPTGMVLIPGGRFRMGDDKGLYPEEGPAHDVTVSSFWIDATEVTVAEFARFVEEARFRTDAERFGWSGVFDTRSKRWMKVAGADWRHPEGPDSPPARPIEPVTQVSWADAVAYSRWCGKRLPTEAEWERAARGHLRSAPFAWGDQIRPGGHPVANWWQGAFPENDTGEDGFRGRSPVGSFPPNGFGLYDVSGNVWEWCSDWFDPHYYRDSPGKNPRGPSTGAERSMRGGSWLCSEDYCARYRVAARSHATPDSGLNNLGFRCARSARR